VNSKGQFSIIAALLVAVVLVGTVITTYATLRFSTSQEQPQVLSAIDETNLALEKVLGFTVGYYGSVLQVTGDTSYAKSLTTNYLNNSLSNIADIKPEWGASFRLAYLDLSANWFTNASYSAAQAVVTYDLPGLGISGMSYSASCRLDVQVLNSSFSSKACLNVTKDGNEPVVNLGKQNFKFYRYQYSNLTWNYAAPSGELTAFANGTYLIDIPTEIDPSSYVVQVTDTRGIMVAAASFSRITSTFMWNTTTALPAADYVDNNSTNLGSQGNFTAQQYGPDSIYDRLTEGTSGPVLPDYYPSSYVLGGSTANVSGALSYLQFDDDVRMIFRSYVSGTSAQTLYAHQETTSIAGTPYYTFKTISADASGLNLTAPMSSSRMLLGKSVYSLQGVSSIPASTWTMYYRTWRDTTTSNSTNSPNSTTGGWTNPTNAYADGNGYANSTLNGTKQVYGGYGFSIPANASITQVRVRLDAYCSGGDSNDKIQLEVSDGTSWFATTQQQSLTASEATYWIDVTGWTSWTPTKVNNTKTRVTQIRSGSLTDEVRLDWIPINVTYTMPIIAHVDADILIRKSDNSTTTIASNVASSGNLQDTPVTLNGTCSWPEYTVVDQKDYLEIDYYVDVTNTTSLNAYLRLDDSSLAPNNQTRIAGVMLPSEYTSEVELIGTSDTQSWAQLSWATDSNCTVGNVTVTVQLYNYTAGQYSASGNGFNSTIIGTSDVTLTQTITVNPADFRNSSTGEWKLKFKAVKSNSTQFDTNIDLVRYSPVPNYMLDIEEQWTNVDYAYPRQDLCVKTGALGSENLLVDVRVGSSWITVFGSLQPNTWNNVSVTPYISSQNFTIRFRDGNSSSDSTPDSWNIDAVLLNPQPDVDALLKPLDHTIVIELLQNGTMRWLGQNLQLTTQEKPVPPVPVKAIHVNQTINGVNQEVPFQVEDWASEYRIPLGLTNNATVFSNRQLIVFLINVNVSKVTVWWNGSDTATQTSLAYTNRYFSVNPSSRTLSNGRLTIQFSSSGFKVTSTLGTTSSTANFMRINSDEDDTDPELAYVIVNGTVRAIVQGEPEWSNGVADCSNVYANTVYTLPANATYFTYQLRLMFINSTARPRTITDLCPIKLSTTLSLSAIHTEDGTVNTSPIVATGTGTFKNYSASGAWTAHHWSQFNSTTGAGAGIMFTNGTNQLLYVFDPTATTLTGSLNVSITTKTIEFSPVTQSLGQVSTFTTPNTYGITWYGAVATFDGTATPIYTMQGTAPTGLWLLVDYQPKITVTSEN